MGEIKSVKVDNWGVFFLQKLQNFFNKTDFCDLTLQFRDNSQLKVHRLVLSACTDFFNVLEQTCELMDDALVMPAELQADVVVPIVNFMYTGTLEFELKMYNKLLKTAKEMNMTVLLKLLEAHRRTMVSSSLNNPSTVTNQIGKNKRVPVNTIQKTPQPIKPIIKPTQQHPQRIQITHAITPPRRGVAKPAQERIIQRPAGSTTILRASSKLQRGTTRFEESNSQTESFDNSFDSISYESKPLKAEPDEYFENQTSSSQWNRSSPFEQLRKGFNNNKRPAVSTFTSPPAKKPNIEDVKEFSEQQRMRKQIAAEFGDDAEFDSIMDDEFHHDDDDEEPMNVNSSPPSSSVAVKQEPQHQQGQVQSSVVIKQSPNEKPTIVVKDSSNSKMDHAKIISEVLRQYPHLVKSNKNIKLKIMPNVGGQSQKIIVKKEAIGNMSAEMEQNESEKTQTRQQYSPQKQQSIIKKPLRSQPQTQTQTVKATESQSILTAPKGAIEDKAAQPSATPQKRRIDSKTMHALIAQGAENMTGPWLCLRCGVNGRPISIPSYRGFRRHLINTHKETIDPALCENCGWRSKNNRLLHHHMLVEHKISSLIYTFPQCKECNKICINEKYLQVHHEEFHPEVHKQQCIYCNKVFVKEMDLYNHMKTFHKKRAREDGVIDFSDEEIENEVEAGRSSSSRRANEGDSKIKILSDIALPSTILKLEQPAAVEEEVQEEEEGEEEYANDSGPKFVNADGNEMVLTAEQRQEIMSQLDQDHDGGVVMVLNDGVFPPEDGTEVEHDLKPKLEDPDNVDEFDETNNEFLAANDINIRGNEMTTEGNVEETASRNEEVLGESEHQERAESDNDDHIDEEEHMEWAENLISAHEADEDGQLNERKDEEEKHTDDESNENELKKNEDEKEEEKPDKEENPVSKKTDDISLKLKMLTGEWTDDEIDEEDDHTEILNPENEKSVEKAETTLESDKNADEKIKSIDIESSKQEDEAVDKFANDAEDGGDNNSLIAEDEVTQSSQFERVEEEEEEEGEGEEEEIIKKEVVQNEKKNSHAEDSEKLEDMISETDVDVIAAAVAIKEELKLEKDESPKEKSSRQASTFKESEETNTDSTDNSSDLSKTIKEKEIESDDLCKEKVDEKNEDSKSKIDDDETAEESKTTSKSTEKELFKTPDKVKSLLNEWADDDEDL